MSLNFKQKIDYAQLSGQYLLHGQEIYVLQEIQMIKP